MSLNNCTDKNKTVKLSNYIICNISSIFFFQLLKKSPVNLKKKWMSITKYYEQACKILFPTIINQFDSIKTLIFF